jgi:NAD(P)-dependent dehydrogenase (short-subunit alcohol dehydrogenase family)
MKGDLYDKKTKIGGKIVVITGIESEVGKATAIDLAKRDGKIYIACQDTTKGEETLKEIKKISGKDNVHFIELNLASLDSIREFSKKFHELENKLDILICNHEVALCPQSKTVEGFEMHFGVNLLGPFLLINMLLDLLKKSPSRIILESSIAYRFGSINKEDIMGENSYSRIKAYCQSKLALHLYAQELSKRLVGTEVTVNVSFPGFVISDIVRRITGVGKTQLILEWIGTQFVNTPKEGAQTTIYAAVDTELQTVTGKFFGNCKQIDIPGDSVNSELSCWLWKKSEELLGMSYI